MHYNLHRLIVELAAEAEPLQREWSLIWAGWPLADGSPGPDVSLQIQLVDALPPLPLADPYFCDNVGILAVYRGDVAKTAVLHYLDGALVTVPLGPLAGPVQITGVVSKGVLQNGRFEDITFTSLAPTLRRHGYYLLHAFAVVKNGRCLLLVGSSGSGKTTTGLHLLEQGWQLLANDVVLLEERADGVYALPTPGAIGIRPGTLTLLPTLAKRLGISQLPLAHPITLSNQQLHGGQWGEGGKITAVYFPQFSDSPQPITPLPRAIQLAHLMAESIDRWDETALPAHIALLERLSQQAEAYQLPITRGILPKIS